MPSLLPLEGYVFRVTENFLRLSEVIGDANWGLTVSEATLVFDRPGAGRLACPAQLVGSESEAAGTWLWAWANAASNLPPAILAAVERLRETAREEGGPDFYQDADAFSMPHPNFGTEMAIRCAGVTGGFTTYRCPYPGGAAHVVVTSCTEAERLPADPMRTVKAITTALSAFSVDHRKAVRAYLGEPDAGGIYQPLGLRLEFDGLGRISGINATLEPPASQKKGLLGRLFGR